ncbi:MAG: photosynthetic reaction center cytochrome PufC [Pseudomonadota bacterium]
MFEKFDKLVEKYSLPWFDKWNRDNPRDVFGPAVLVAALGSGVFLAVLLMIFGSAYQTDSDQTGPAGTGMHVAKFKWEQAPDPTIEDYYADEPWVPEGGEPLAKDIYQNVQVLGDLTEDNFNRLMAAMTVWVSPEQGCAYCHGDGDLDTYGSDDLYTKVVSRRMIQMTQNINENWDAHVASDGEGGVNCYTCHRGQNVPSGIWFNVAPGLEVAEGWGAVQNLATAQGVSTSLPHDALEKYLLDGEQISVHDLEPRVPSDPTVDRTWQDTERTYSLMNYFSHSLGRNCVFCHNSRAFYDGAQVTPQWGTAAIGIQMVLEMNEEYLVPLQDTYPENRLGPKHGDAPKAACLTCHKGYNKPMGGMDMISGYPALAGSGPPSYE